MKADKKSDKEVQLNYICIHFIYASIFHLPQVIDATASARVSTSPKVTPQHTSSFVFHVKVKISSI